MTGRLSLRDDRERSVIGIWRNGQISRGSIRLYLGWVRRFRSYCQRERLCETDQLTLIGVSRFTSNYVGPRRKRALAPSSCDVARNALHAWACALEALGVPVPVWRRKNIPPALSPLLIEYCQYRRSHIGVAEG